MLIKQPPPPTRLCHTTPTSEMPGQAANEPFIHFHIEFLKYLKKRINLNISHNHMLCTLINSSSSSSSNKKTFKFISKMI